eukprot:2362763-Prymnesium_polylepis.1
MKLQLYRRRAPIGVPDPPTDPRPAADPTAGMLPPPWVVVEVVALCLGVAYYSRHAQSEPPYAQSDVAAAPPSRAVVSVRCCFVANIIATMVWSWLTLQDVVLCNDAGDRCFSFTGWVQVSTFTRWSWMLQGLYFACANLRLPIARQLFGVSLSSAMLVTIMVYAVLVPGAWLRPQPAHLAGNIAVLTSPQGHIMHS